MQGADGTVPVYFVQGGDNIRLVIIGDSTFPAIEPILPYRLLCDSAQKGSSILHFTMSKQPKWIRRACGSPAEIMAALQTPWQQTKSTSCEDHVHTGLAFAACDCSRSALRIHWATRHGDGPIEPIPGTILPQIVGSQIHGRLGNLCETLVHSYLQEHG